MPQETFSNYLNLIALLLIVPLGVLTNIITPKLQNWWAERSKYALAARVTRLKHDLELANQRTPLTDAEIELFKGMEGVLKLIWSVGYFILTTVSVFAGTLIPKGTPGRWDLTWGTISY